MSRTQLTERQKRLRTYARREGARARAAINNAWHPVYEGDEVMWESIAVAFARAAWRYALASEMEQSS